MASSGCSTSSGTARRGAPRGSRPRCRATWRRPGRTRSHGARAGMMVRNRPIVLHDGELPAADLLRDGDDTESVGPKSTSRFLRFDTKTQAVEAARRDSSAKGNIQPAVVEVAPGPPDRLFPPRRRLRTDHGRLAWCAPNPPMAAGRGARDATPLSPTRIGRRFPEALVEGRCCWSTTTTCGSAARSMLALSDDRTDVPVKRNIATGKNGYAYPIASRRATAASTSSTPPTPAR